MSDYFQIILHSKSQHLLLKDKLEKLFNFLELRNLIEGIDLKELSEVFPQLNALDNIPKLEKIEDVNFDFIDGIFCCLPHATTQDIVLKLPRHLSIVDLSADFRLRDPDEYEEWLFTF